MSQTISGYHNTAQTLSASTPNVTITGTINAYGLAGTYSVHNNGSPTSQTLHAAVFGPAGTSFFVDNTGLIEINGANPSNPFNVGILLGSPGDVINSGTVAGASGIAVFDSASVGTTTINNGGKITGSVGVGIYMASAGSVVNSGAIFGAQTAVNLSRTATSYLSNSSTGIIGASVNYAVQLHDGVVKNAGLLEGGAGGVQLYAQGTILNAGTIEATLTTAGTNSSYAGIDIQQSGQVFNSLSGHISGQVGIAIQGSGPNYVYNAGSITGAGNNYAIGITAANGLVLNNVSQGTISGVDKGVYVQSGAVNIQNAGLIQTTGANGFNRGIDLSTSGTAGTIVNTGTIESASGTGVWLRGSATLINHNLVQGLYVGAKLKSYGVVDNTGTILNLDNAALLPDFAGGVVLTSGGSIHNSGLMESNQLAVAGLNVAASVYNSGTIEGRGSSFTVQNTTVGTLNLISEGVYLAVGGTVTNAGGGLITGVVGVSVQDSGMVANQFGGNIIGSDAAVVAAATPPLFVTIDNAGHLGATGTSFVFQGITYDATGVFLSGGGTINNAVSGTISGNLGVDLLNGNDTLINAGLIAGGASGTAVYFTGSNNRLVLDAGGRFVGAITNIAANGALEMASGGSAGSFDMGGTVSGFNSITFDAGGSWTLEGNFAELGGPGVTISGFAPSDTLVLDGFTASSETFGAGVLTLSNGVATETINLQGSFTTGDFRITDVTAGTQITEVTCYARGTRITTSRGEVAVEELEIGDLVETMHAGLQPVKWIGVRSYAAPFANHDKVLPIRIRAGALADGVPARDLMVSPGHAICLDGVLVHAARLVNGVSITQLPRVDEITYFHIELENHEIIFAENCPAETFMGEYFRPQFHNAESFQALYPQDRAPEHMCLPRLDSGFQLDAIQRRLAVRAGLVDQAAEGALRGYIDIAGPQVCAGWAQHAAAPNIPVCLDIVSQGRRIGRVLANQYREDVHKAGYGNGYHGFEFVLPEGMDGPVEVRRSTDAACLPLAGSAAVAAA